MPMNKQTLRVGVGGPVGSGKTALLEVLCKALRDRYDIAVVTNDIYTQEDAQILMRAQALPVERIVGAAGVLARGGEVLSIPFEHEQSTSALLARIRGAGS